VGVKVLVLVGARVALAAGIAVGRAVLVTVSVLEGVGVGGTMRVAVRLGVSVGSEVFVTGRTVSDGISGWTVAGVPGVRDKVSATVGREARVGEGKVTVFARGGVRVTREVGSGATGRSCAAIGSPNRAPPQAKAPSKMATPNQRQPATMRCRRVR